MLLNFIAYSLLFMSSLSFCSEGPKSVPDRNDCTTPPAQTMKPKLSTREMELLYSPNTPSAVCKKIVNKNRRQQASPSTNNNH